MSSKFGLVTQADIDYYHRKPRATECKHGHKLTPSNVKYYFHNEGTIKRICKKCECVNNIAQYEKNKDRKRALRIGYDDHWTDLLIGGI